MRMVPHLTGESLFFSKLGTRQCYIRSENDELQSHVGCVTLQPCHGTTPCILTGMIKKNDVFAASDKKIGCGQVSCTFIQAPITIRFTAPCAIGTPRGVCGFHALIFTLIIARKMMG